MGSKIERYYSAGGVVLNSKGEVLVVEQVAAPGQTDGSWSLPKGGIDPGEEPLAAAKREIYEETGVKELTYVKELGEFSRSPYMPDGTYKTHIVKTITMYLFTTDQMELAPIDLHNPQALWVSVKEVSQKITHPIDKEFFESIRDQLTEL